MDPTPKSEETVPLEPALYVVATPIGNLEDITLRALRVLRSASVIACEDTRHTQKLLNHFDIHTKTISYHEHNEAERAEELVARIARGEAVALVSDAGTPGISDPGGRVIGVALERGVRVVPVPGAVAFISALTGSGMASGQFTFLGFLPAKSGQRRTALEQLRPRTDTVIFYEAPHRIVDTLEDIQELLGVRPIAVARELTKMHEEVLRGTAATVLKQLQSRAGALRGEFVLIIGAAAASRPFGDKTALEGKKEETENLSAAALHQRLAEIMSAQSLDERSALKVLAKERNVGKSELYRELQRTRGTLRARKS